ncbi:hypothetical protein EJB05_46902, partial [Eragrostis curvula]
MVRSPSLMDCVFSVLVSHSFTMSEMVGSAIVGEAVSRVFSGIISKYVDNPDERANAERLEMAHIKMEAAVEMSSKWQITEMSLLRWRTKLKRTSQECNHMMRECKRRSQEDKRFQEQTKQSSLPIRLAHATKSFMSSVVGQKNDECSSNATVQRFERLANDFLKYVQLGKHVQYEMWHESQYHYFGIRPMSLEGRGLEAMLGFVYEDHEMPENSFHIGCMLRLSESTNILGTTIRCLQLVTPHFKSTAEVVIKELIQLPTQDFCWLSPRNAYGNMEHWNNIHNTLTRRLRPDPLCCQVYELLNMAPACTSRRTNASRLSDIFPEPVNHVFLHRLIPLSEYDSQGPVTRRTLKLGVLFAPHDCVDDFKSAVGVESSSTEAIDGEKQQCTHVDVYPHQLDEMLLPNAIDYLSRNVRATTYQISWKSRHGSAHLCVEKLNTQTIIACRTMTQGGKKSKFLELQDRLNKGQWKQLRLPGKAKHGGEGAAAAESKFYPADDVKPRQPSTRKPKCAICWKWWS